MHNTTAKLSGFELNAGIYNQEIRKGDTHVHVPITERHSGPSLEGFLAGLFHPRRRPRPRFHDSRTRTRGSRGADKGQAFLNRRGADKGRASLNRPQRYLSCDRKPQSFESHAEDGSVSFIFPSGSSAICRMSAITFVTGVSIHLAVAFDHRLRKSVSTSFFRFTWMMPLGSIWTKVVDSVDNGISFVERAPIRTDKTSGCRFPGDKLRPDTST